MNEKYYTPEIEEFHVGFEYYNKEGDDYVKKIFGQYEVNNNFYIEFSPSDFIDEWTFVKYLDQADIEELGWQIRKEAEGIIPYLYRLKPQKLIFPHNPELHTVYLAQTNSSYKRCLIYLQQDSIVGVEKNMPEILLFNGIIKNKSELKRLMKQLGI